jgi:hypothetical protein
LSPEIAQLIKSVKDKGAVTIQPLPGSWQRPVKPKGVDAKAHIQPAPPPPPQQQYIPPEVLRLMELGRKKLLWAIEAIYTLNGSAYVYKRRNLVADELMKVREDMFKYGILHPVEQGHWKVATPLDIQDIDVYKQERYMPDGM